MENSLLSYPNHPASCSAAAWCGVTLLSGMVRNSRLLSQVVSHLHLALTLTSCRDRPATDGLEGPGPRPKPESSQGCELGHAVRLAGPQSLQPQNGVTALTLRRALWCLLDKGKKTGTQAVQDFLEDAMPPGSSPQDTAGAARRLLAGRLRLVERWPMAARPSGYRMPALRSFHQKGHVTLCSCSSGHSRSHPSSGRQTQARSHALAGKESAVLPLLCGSWSQTGLQLPAFTCLPASGGNTPPPPRSHGAL